MHFRLRGVDRDLFLPLFGLPDADLAARGILRKVVDRSPGFPDRIAMRDAPLGETVLLLNYVHQPVATPFQSSHAIFVHEGAEAGYDREDEVPEVLRRRLLSVRAFDAGHMMIDADVVEGVDLEPLIARFFADPATAHLDVHYARWGCWAGRIDRVDATRAD